MGFTWPESDLVVALQQAADWWLTEHNANIEDRRQAGPVNVKISLFEMLSRLWKLPKSVMWILN